MDSQRNIVFIGEDDNIFDLWNEIQKRIEVSLGSDWYFGQKMLIAFNDSDYKVVTIIGNFIAAQKNYNVKWVDKKGHANPIDSFCVCKLKRSCFDEIDIFDIKQFCIKLSEKIGIEVKYNISSSKDEYEIRISIYDIYKKFKSPFCRYAGKNIFIDANDVLESIADYVDEYIKEKDLSLPLFSVEIIDFDGGEFNTRLVEKHINILKLDSYFKATALYTGIFYPEGRNIAPKLIPNEKKSNDKYYITHMVNNARIMQEGRFKELADNECVSCCKDYIVSYEEYYNNPEHSCFKFDDKVKIDYQIKIISDRKLKVVCKVKGKRTTLGNKLTDDNIIYKVLDVAKYESCEYEFETTDYYEIINFNTLLHYTDLSKYYETYEIPIGFRFVQGLSDLDNITNYSNYFPGWIDYKDISEVIADLNK